MLPERVGEWAGADPAALDDASLKQLLCDLASVRATIDALESIALVELDDRGSCVTDGQVTVKTWLAHHTGVARSAAGSRVALAHKLRKLPILRAAMTAGHVTESHARVLARTVKPRLEAALVRDEALLVAKAMELDADDYAVLIAEWLLRNDPDGAEPGDGEPSVLHVSGMLGGRLRLDGELDFEDAVEFRAELEAVYDELWHQDQAADESDPLKQRSHSQRMAAALVEVARRSSAAGDRDDDPDPDVSPVKMRRPRQKQIIVLAPIEALDRSTVRPLASLDDGTPVPPDVLDQWACDSPVGRILTAAPSLPLDVGRITYLATDGQRRALAVRDRGCIVPGCRRKPKWCEAHHVLEWQKGGPTNLDNLVLLCRRHHKHVHQRIITIVRDDAARRFIATRPDGTRLLERPPPTLAA